MLPFYCSWIDEDLRIFSESINKFIDQEIEPFYEKWEEDKWMPREVWNKLGEAGLLCVDIPEEYGGFGVDFKFAALIYDNFYRRGVGAIAGGWYWCSCRYRGSLYIKYGNRRAKANLFT